VCLIIGVKLLHRKRITVSNDVYNVSSYYMVRDLELFCTLSLSPIAVGDHTQVAYSRCGLTMHSYIGREIVLPTWVNVLRRMLNILFPLLIQFAICELKGSLSSAITPRSFSSDVVARVCYHLVSSWCMLCSCFYAEM